VLQGGEAFALTLRERHQPRADGLSVPQDEREDAGAREVIERIVVAEVNGLRDGYWATFVLTGDPGASR
jgi:hypothetical protein